MNRDHWGVAVLVGLGFVFALAVDWPKRLGLGPGTAYGIVFGAWFALTAGPAALGPWTVKRSVGRGWQLLLSPFMGTAAAGGYLSVIFIAHYFH